MFALFKSSARAQSRNATAQVLPESTVVHAPRCADSVPQPASAVDRLMARIDYYMHCELDVEYDHARPEQARDQLRAQIEQELATARDSGWMMPNFASQTAANGSMQPPGVHA